MNGSNGHVLQGYNFRWNVERRRSLGLRAIALAACIAASATVGIAIRGVEAIDVGLRRMRAWQR